MGVSEQKDIEEVEQLVTIGYMDAVHSNDPSSYASLFSEDGMWMPPESQPVVGRIAIIARQDRGLAMLLIHEFPSERMTGLGRGCVNTRCRKF